VLMDPSHNSPILDDILVMRHDFRLLILLDEHEFILDKRLMNPDESIRTGSAVNFASSRCESSLLR
jgi:hypothetical protein